jgi:hypothetical protein
VGIGTDLSRLFFGQLDFVKANFEKVVLAIVVISFIPVALEWLKAKQNP